MENLLINFILKQPNKMITYAQYIEQALYHPQKGYYMKEKQKIGRKGDFITTSNISNLYAKLICRWFYKVVELYDLDCSVCEIGPGTGKFAKAFIDEWATLTSKPLHYFLLEQSPYHRKLQQEIISFNGHVKQISSLHDIQSFNGLIFSNELFDAFPVHVIEKREGKLFEIMVTVDEEIIKLTEKRVLLSNQIIIDYLADHPIYLEEGQRIEIPITMVQYIRDIAATVEKGIVMTVDYGYTKEEWSEPSRRNGSLRGYKDHEMFHSVLEHPGDMDITTHIHIDTLISEGEKNDLALVYLLRQDEFLLRAGILQELQENFDPNPFSEQSKLNRAVRTLIMPGGISQSFYISVQTKALPLNKEKLCLNKILLN